MCTTQSYGFSITNGPFKHRRPRNWLSLSYWSIRDWSILTTPLTTLLYPILQHYNDPLTCHLTYRFWDLLHRCSKPPVNIVHHNRIICIKKIQYYTFLCPLNHIGYIAERKSSSKVNKSQKYSGQWPCFHNLSWVLY